MFVQYMCKQSEEDLAAKESTVNMCMTIEVISIAIVWAFAFAVRVWLADQMEKNDENYLTTSDYTAYIEIDRETSDKFDDHIHIPKLDKSRGQQFKEFVYAQIKAFTRDDSFRIARMDLVFDNNHMIDMLKARGEAIKSSDSARVFVTEFEIRKFVARQYWTRVTGVFVTFERDTDVILAQEICEKATPRLFG